MTRGSKTTAPSEAASSWKEATKTYMASRPELVDRKYLGLVIEKFDGGPVGVGTISLALGEARDKLKDVYEPFLFQSGLIQRTSCGRSGKEGAPE